MSDTAPWEDYSAPAPKASAGNDAAPWEDYAPAPAEPVYDADLFRQRVGRDPSSTELANFKQFKGVGFAGDPTQGKFTAGQAAVGAVEGTASLGSSVVAAVPTAVGYLAGAAGLTGKDSSSSAQAVQNAMTYKPRTEAGQAGMDVISQISNGPTETAARVADLLDKSGVSGDTVRDVAQRLGYVAPIFGDLVAGAPVIRATGRAIRRDVAASRVPPGVEYDTAGNPLPQSAPKPTYDSEGNVIQPAPAATPDDVRGASAATPPTFDEAPKPEQPGTEQRGPGFNSADQAQRAQTLREVGLTEARDSAVTGDRKAAATDFQQSKLDNEGGKELSKAFENERTTLGNYADQLIADSGGSTGLDETSLHNRGSTILQPLEGFSDRLDAETSRLYREADARAQGMPAELKSTAQALSNRAEFIGTTEGQQLLRGVNTYMRQAGIADDAGQIGGATVQQAERLKQYLNNQWTPRTARLIRTLKDSIDDDVAQSAGGDVYQQARALRANRAAILDNPKGVSSLLDSSGPNGMNRPVSVEKVPDTILRMPVDQFGHIVDTLRAMPDDLQLQAQGAINEIRAQALLRMQEQATKYKDIWNNKGVTQYLNANSAKLARVFSTAELRRLRSLNDAGNILDVNRAYPGAAAQGHNLLVRGALGAIEHGTGAIGAHIAGPVGALAGEVAGRAASKALHGSLSRKAARARIRNL